MAEIYVAFVDTPGLFALLIRRVIRQRYIHVALAFDRELKEAYSVGRRNPAVPLLAGFEREDREKILHKYPHARYQICRISCTEQQKRELEEQARSTYKKRFSCHYVILGLPFVVLQRPFYQKNHYTCSSWLAKVTQEAGLQDWGKHFSMVTPRDVYEAMGKDSGRGQLIFEGELAEWMRCGAQKKWTAVTV
ncbi:MAG: hypothetical protein Q4C65_14340 [Eubacteriales bacterium]|nr:hypothetical protein [Eubacteriales bacterium]